nr:outer membrane protein OmpK [Ferrimonas sediminicola]
MKKMLAGAALTALSLNAFAADYTDGDIHKNDYKWSQFNLMYAYKQLPRAESQTHTGHDYMEMEFGGRSGIFDLYGYVDVFNLTNAGQDSSASDKMFMKFAPRISLDALTGKDLSFGPVQEVYFSTLFNWSGNGVVNDGNFGIGADVMVPWLGKTGMNLMASYEIGAEEWDGFHFAMNWFKPFKFFENGSFLSFQGYIDYEFGIDESYLDFNDDGVMDAQLKTSSGGDIFLGLYWHSDRYAVGYGLKGFKDVYGLKDGGAAGDTTGWSHYFAVTYKF